MPDQRSENGLRSEDGVQASAGVEIRKEAREEAGAASDNSRKDNKAEGVS